MHLELFEANLCFVIVSRDLRCVLVQDRHEANTVILTPFLTLEILDAALSWHRDNIQGARLTFEAIAERKPTFLMAAYDPAIQDIAEESLIQIADPPPLTVIQLRLTATALEVA